MKADAPCAPADAGYSANVEHASEGTVRRRAVHLKNKK